MEIYPLSASASLPAPASLNTAPSATPAPIPATEWKTKEQAALLERETNEQRDNRSIAEDPNTPASVLEKITRQALHARFHDRFAWFRHQDEIRKQQEADGGEADPALWKRAPWRHSELLLQAVAAHPNTPPALLIELIGLAPLIAQATRAFFSNPVVPFLLLEQPGFLNQMDGGCQMLLLREEIALPLFVRMLADDIGVAQESAVQEAARMHVSLAGELPGEEAARAALRNYRENVTVYSRTHKWQAPLRPEQAESPKGSHRLEAIARVEATSAPMTDDFYNRSGLDLLHYLTRDGNRLVRWEAKKRLAAERA